MISTLLGLLLLAILFRGSNWWRNDRRALDEVLASGEAAGIISAAQREQLLAHASEASGGRRLGATWLAIAAGLFVVAGVSLIIARNWDTIGPTERIGAFLVVLLCVGEAAIRYARRTAAVALSLEILWLLLPLLGIGLYAQTFQLSGDTIRPFLVWLLLAAPLAWLSPRPVAASLHTAGAALVLFAGNFGIDTALDATGAARSIGGTMALFGGTPTAIAWGLSAALLATIVVQSVRLLPEGHRHHFIGLGAVWLFMVLTMSVPLRLGNEAWMIFAAAGLVVLCLATHILLATSMFERRSSAGAWIGGVYAMTFLWHATSTPTGTSTTAGVGVALAIAVAAVAMVLVTPPARLSPSTTWAWSAKIVLLAPLLAAALLPMGRVELWWTIAVLMNLLLLGTGVGLMWHGSLVRETVQINAGVVIVVTLLVTRFLDVFGGMLRSGLGFIAAGLLLGALAFALERTRRRLIHVPAEASQ